MSRGLRPAALALVAAVALSVGLGAAAACSGGDAGEPPLDITTLPAEIAVSYRFAEANQPLLEQIACYCGCAITLEHRHLYDCFLRDSAGDSAGDGGKYEPHALGCGVCLAEARDVEQLVAAGESAEAIRIFIDERYAALAPPGGMPAAGGW